MFSCVFGAGGGGIPQHQIELLESQFLIFTPLRCQIGHILFLLHVVGVGLDGANGMELAVIGCLGYASRKVVRGGARRGGIGTSSRGESEKREEIFRRKKRCLFNRG